MIQSFRRSILVTLVAVGCAERPAAPTWNVLRLVDRIADAQVTSSIDLAQSASFAIAGTVRCPLEDRSEIQTRRGPVVSGPFGFPDGPGGVELADGQSPSVTLNGPAVFWWFTPTLEDGWHDARVDAVIEPESEIRIVSVPVPPNHAHESPNANYWLKYLRARLGKTDSDLEAIAPPDDIGRVALKRRFRPRRDEIRMIAVVAVKGRIRIDDVRLDRPTELGSRLERSLGPSSGSPWVRRVGVDGEIRESVVIGADGHASFRVDLPESPARLRLGVTAVVPHEDDDLRAEVTVTCDGETIGTEIGIAGIPTGRAWSPVDLDLARFAARTVRIELRGTRADHDRSRPVALAFGAPVLAVDLPDDRPDVVVISLDTVRADRLSLYGYPRETSPTLARLASTSAVFDAAISPSPWTLPSHVTLFSGQLPDRHAVRRTTDRIRIRDVPMIADEFRNAGYVTAAVTGGGYVGARFGFSHGFDEYLVNDPVQPRDRTIQETVDRSRRARTRLLEHLDSPRRAPLFLFAHTYVAHSYDPVANDLAAVGAPAEWIDAYVPNQRWMNLRRRITEAGESTEFTSEIDDLSLRYDAALRDADRFVASILDGLERSGRTDRTLLVIVSDHGEELGERGSFGHGHAIHEELIRVPFLLSGPGVEARRILDVVSLADVAPTVRALSGLPPQPNRVDGRSLVPLLRGEAKPTEPAIAYVEQNRTMIHALRGARWKLRRTIPPSGTNEVALFDLQGAGEAMELSGVEPERASRMRDALERRLSALRARSTGADQHALTAELTAELKELGYLGDDR